MTQRAQTPDATLQRVRAANQKRDRRKARNIRNAYNGGARQSAARTNQMLNARAINLLRSVWHKRQEAAKSSEKKGARRKKAAADATA